MAEIRCPMCSKWNPAELDECQYCHARLKPIVASPSEKRPETPKPSAGGPPPAKPQPTPEAETPDWLNSLRSRQDMPASEEGEESSAGAEAAPAEDVPDWLSRIREREETPTEESQPSEPTELPGWLSSSEEAPSKESPESAEPPAFSAGGDLPDWLRGDRAESTPEAEQAAPFSEPSSEPDWLEQLRSPSPSAAESAPSDAFSTPPQEPSPTGETPDLTADQIPSWLRDFSGPTTSSADQSSDFTPPADQPPAPFAGNAEPGEIPDWLRGLGAAEPEIPPEEPPADAFAAPPASQMPLEGSLPPEDLPEWLSNIAGEPPEEPTESQPFAAETPAEEPGKEAQPSGSEDWLSAFKSEIEPGLASAEGAADTGLPGESSQSGSGETPDWLAGLTQGSETGETPGQPDWLASFAKPAGEEDQSSEPSQEEPGLTPRSPHVRTGLTGWLGHADEIGKDLTTPALPEPSESEAGDAGASDWLTSLQQSVPEPEEPAPTTPFQEEEQKPAVEPAEEKPVVPFAGGDLPDWISDLGPTQSAPTEEPAGPGQETPPSGPFVPIQPGQETPGEPENLVPAELPSWVQAMRPVESAAPSAEPRVVQENDQRIENAGPLSGLRGILPAEPSAGDYRRPPTYSVKLQVNETQRRSAQILEDLLASENVPLPPRTERMISSQRILRLVIAVIIIAAVLLGALNPLIPVPNLYPPEALALRSVIDRLPDNAPVLLAVDYEPSLAGEMQSSASGVLTHLMAKNARLALITTTPTGTALGENLLSSVIQGKDNLQSYSSTGDRIARLGYLAGGPVALLEFARNPQFAAPAYLPNHVDKAWNQPILQDVTSVNEFKAVIVLTDNVDTGRAWLEQFQPQLSADIPFLMVTSAQAAPMLRTYLDSGQVDGMVSGLAGGAGYEQLVQAQGPGFRNWNAFQAGMLATLILVLAGGLFNGISGLFNRRKTKEEA